MKVIILTASQYKEKDTIVNAINSEKSVSFLVRGSLSPKSKNALLNNPLSIVDVEFNEGNYKYPVVKASSMIFSPLTLSSNLESYASLMAVHEITLKLLQEEERHYIYNDLEETLENIKNGVNPRLALVAYFATVMKVAGYEFEVNQCVLCGSKKDIRAFSFEDGGFICGNCLDEQIKPDLNRDQMLLLRNVINGKCTNLKSVAINNQEDINLLLNKFYDFVFENLGISMESKKLLNN